MIFYSFLPTFLTAFNFKVLDLDIMELGFDVSVLRILDKVVAILVFLMEILKVVAESLTPYY